MMIIKSKKLDKTRTLYENEWLELKIMEDPDNGVDGYVFSHESRCKGKIISVLPFRRARSGYEFLLRLEITPSWGLEPVISSITGGYEEDEGVNGTAIMELKEEGGYDVEESDLIDLGECYGIKSSDSIYYLFSVDLTNKEIGEAPGDGSELESKAECFWTDDISTAQDPMVYISYVRLKNKLKQEID